MKSSPLKRKTALSSSPEGVRAFTQRARENSTRKPRPVSPASRAQRAIVRGVPCCVCGGLPVDAAHLIDRSLCAEGADDPRAVVPLCRIHHREYDLHRLDLLPHLEGRYGAELGFAVGRFGLLRTLERVTGDRYVVESAA